ncbi:MAG: MSMEG_1061 family FMN-dependent PPOX-type flavoprotein [Sphingobium sp.]
MSDDPWLIDNEASLRAVIGAPMESVRAKVVQRLNEAMRHFVAQSPLILLSTIDEHGRPDVSPKGDPAGFVKIDGAGDLLIPERPGNRLIFGFHNILRNPEVGLIFIVPHQRETLRVKGVATLRSDPDIVAQMQVNGKPAILYTHVAVRECFFHCGKALIRSHVWEPAKWPPAQRSIASRQFFGPAPLDEEARTRIEGVMDEAYREHLY